MKAFYPLRIYHHFDLDLEYLLGTCILLRLINEFLIYGLAFKGIFEDGLFSLVSKPYSMGPCLSLRFTVCLRIKNLSLMWDTTCCDVSFLLEWCLIIWFERDIVVSRKEYKSEANQELFYINFFNIIAYHLRKCVQLYEYRLTDTLRDS